MKIFRLLILGSLLIFSMAPAINAQCDFDYPEALEVGDSYCIQTCAVPFMPHGFFVVGNPASTAENFPVLIFESGCSPASTNCTGDCTPFTVPSGEWQLGVDPFNVTNDPDYYYLGNDCIGFYIKYIHANPATWDFFFVMYPGLGCEGCFCMTFDHELPVELMDFTAVAGDGEVALNWRTASEANADHFEITRNDVMVKSVVASNIATGCSYHWVDTVVENGVSYAYGLYSVDMDGSRSLLNEVEATPRFNTGTVSEYALYQNYPNPFNPETQIAFDLVESQFVTLKVMNLLGQEVATVASGEFNAGRHTVNFNGSDLTSGVYLYTITTDNFSATRKLVLLK